jgi:hypothetical protein
MKLFLGISLLAAVMVLSSCDTLAKSSASKTPATPKPAAAVAQTQPPAPAPPISTPQTEIQLPPAQPVSNEALATIQPPPEPKAPEPAEPEPTTKPPTRRPPAPRPAEATAPAATAETQPTPPAEERPRLQPVYTEEERRRILGEIERRRGEIDGILRGINQSRVPSNQRGVIDSIHSFLSSCDDSAKRGDLRSAEALSERALLLARELASGR